MNIAFPYTIDGRGRSAESSTDDHIREMIEQFLFTNPGERVNRPDFGSGLQQLLFAPNSPELASALKFSMQAGLNRWMSDLIELRALDVQVAESELRITISYFVRSTNETSTTQLVRSI